MLLAATLASLGVTIVAGYLTRLSLVDASAWVTHTDEVKLALDECEFALVRNDDEALKKAEAKVDHLTIDNHRQQQSVTRAVLLHERNERGSLEDLFASMQREEDRLLVERRQRISSEEMRSSIAFLAGAVLTLLFGASLLAMLRAQHQENARQKGLLEAIIESVDEGIIAVEASRTMLAMNAVARSMVGRSFPRDELPDDWRGHIRATYEDGSSMEPEEAPLARALRGETSEDLVYRILPAEGHRVVPGVWVSTTARPIRDESGRVVAAVATLRDITEQRAKAERLHDLSLTDELTGLLNRRGFLTLANARFVSSRAAKAPLALLYADLNGLKRINDELGHEQGDRAIKDAAGVFRGVFRDGDILARIGGDEFVALLPNFSSDAREPLLERLASAIRSHVEREDRPYRLSLSAGVTLMNWKSDKTLDELLADADRSMYARKRERAEQSLPTLRVVSPPARDRRD